MDHETIICAGCGKKAKEYGYCEETAESYGECCWNNHVQSCSLCQELAQDEE